MATLNGIVSGLFDVVCRPLGGHPAWAMVVLAGLTGVWALALFKLATPQKRLARSRDLLFGHIFEMGMYQDHLRVLAKIQKDLALANLRYLALSLPALVVLIVPMVLTLAQLEGRFAKRPLHSGEATVLTVGFAAAPDPDKVRLELPPGVMVEAGPVFDRQGGAMAWRLRVNGVGELPARVTVAGKTAADIVLHAGEGLPLTSRKLGATWWEKLLYPGWRTLPADSPVSSWEATYPDRHVAYLGIGLNWLVAFMILSVAAGLACKDALGVEM
ncbi:hypothetical protein COW53_06470 [bacterium CG17_big_fil_post_rev_8_21_14_2_50_64_8]|nr:MAG: hypothetical protein COW53_06470 [bacterium CG17_big_fil_post_rev_8_21_14_2_50_64_8]PJA76802.1 MAG: hypothetical protein CO151_01705 [bacterium CG_4_9_14_3_um_filter_65_15]